jgi:hypothetical protein
MPRYPMLIASLILVALAAGAALVWAQQPPAVESPTADGPTKLAVLWTSGDPDVAHRMALMYAHFAKTSDWFEEVELIVWGPSQRLLVGDHSLQEKLAEMQADGVITRACIVCANTFGIAEELRALDLEVLPMGGPLTEYLKSPEWEVLTL